MDTLIRAKYHGICSTCGRAIGRGDLISWEPGGPTRHADCPAVELPPDAIHLAVGEGYGGHPYQPGTVVHNYRGHEPRYLMVLQSGMEYYREDGMSFGVGDDAGYIYWADCRPATEDEATPLREEDEQAERISQARAAVTRIGLLIRNTGERPVGIDRVEGDRILDTRNIYGAGICFVVTPEYIWYLEAHGMDGDDWSANNIPGHQGYRIARDEAVVQQLEACENLLNPEMAQRRRNVPPAWLAVLGELWQDPLPSCSTRSLAQVHLTQVHLADSLFRIGLDDSGIIWIRHKDEHMPFEQTPQRLARFVEHIPDWTSLDEIQAVVRAGSLVDGLPNLPPGLLGRFQLRDGWEANARDALVESVIRDVPLDEITVTPGPQIVHTHAGRLLYDGGWQLWDDGRVTTGQCHHTSVTSLSEAASAILAAALRQPEWREAGRWETLSHITEVGGSEEIDTSTARSYGGGCTVRIDRIEAKADVQVLDLYRVWYEWGAMGEDGDGGDSTYIYDSLPAARTKASSLLAAWL